MPTQDRTNEFRACVESIRARTPGAPGSSNVRQRLLDGKSGAKSDFTRMASGIGKDISSTNLKLGKLAQRTWSALNGFADTNESHRLRETVAKRKTLFDDRPVEISVRHLAASLDMCIDTLSRN